MPSTLLSNRDNALYNLALRIAEESDCTDKHGAVIMRSGTILAVAANRFIGNPISARYLKKTIHSEQRAILRLGPGCKGSILYTARLHRNKQSGPCSMCYQLIREAGIQSIVYHTGVELRKIRIGNVTGDDLSFNTYQSTTS